VTYSDSVGPCRTTVVADRFLSNSCGSGAGAHPKEGGCRAAASPPENRNLKKTRMLYIF
jgi:hypothetical protein